MKSVLAFTAPGGAQWKAVEQNETMTTGVDAARITIPSGELWLIFWGYIKNGSGTAIDLRVYVDDANKTMPDIVNETNVANGGIVVFPNEEGTEDLTKLGHGAFPLLLTSGKRINFIWSADAGKSGTSGYYLEALRIGIVT